MRLNISPIVGGMTNVTGLFGRYVIRTFPCCNCAIMTTIAGTYHLVVVDCYRRRPVGGASCMACFTKVSGINVIGRLTGRLHSIMTNYAGTCNFKMINNDCRCPLFSRVTGYTFIWRSNMIFILSSCCNTIVTGNARLIRYQAVVKVNGATVVVIIIIPIAMGAPAQ